MKKTILVLTLALAGCNSGIGSNLPGNLTAQQAVAKLCARPDLMANVLTTPQLQQGWTWVCDHVASVSTQPLS